MRLTFSHQWPVHSKVTPEEAASRADRPRGEAAAALLHEIYDIAIALDTAGCVLTAAAGARASAVRLLDDGNGRQPGEEDLPSPSLYVSAGFPTRSLLVFDQAGRQVAEVTLSLHSAVHVAGVPATSESVLQRYHIGRLLIHQRSLYVADCEFDFIYVCDLAGDVRHVISWPEELSAPMGMCVGSDRLFVCDSGHRRVRVYDAVTYRPVPGEDSPGHFAGIHTRGVCQCRIGQQLQLVAGDFETGQLLTLQGWQLRRLDSVAGVKEPFAVIPGPLPDSVFVSSSGMQGDHSVKLVSLGPGQGDCRILATCGGHGSHPGQFNKPRGLAFDPASGRLYAVDAKNFRVQVFQVESA